jgi:hypothetical protein
VPCRAGGDLKRFRLDHARAARVQRSHGLLHLGVPLEYPSSTPRVPLESSALEPQLKSIPTLTARCRRASVRVQMWLRSWADVRLVRPAGTPRHATPRHATRRPNGPDPKAPRPAPTRCPRSGAPRGLANAYHHPPAPPPARGGRTHAGVERRRAPARRGGGASRA